MFSMLKLALRNLLRHRRKNAISIVTIAFGLSALVVFGGFVSSMYQGMRESLIRSQLGHLQITKTGYDKAASDQTENLLISQDEQEKLSSIIESLPEVEIVTARLNFSALMSNGERSTSVVGFGMDSDKEAIMNSALYLKEGEDLFPEDQNSALLGEALAKSMGVEPGDYVTLLSSTTLGAINAVDVKVSGLVTSGLKDVDRYLIRANLPHIQTLMDTTSVSRLVVLLTRTDQTMAVKNRLNVLFKQAGLTVQIKTWSDLADSYHKVRGLFDAIFMFIKVIVLLIILIGISNIMMMNVLERTQEIGTLRAMGTTRSQVMRQFLTEGALIGLLGSLIGLACGAGIAHIVTEMHLPMPTPPGSTVQYPIRVFVVPWQYLEAFLYGFFITALSALLPAIRAARLKVVDALRSV
ncbi:FtsX-like permease family protein [Marinobacteraceae bacterium S3BR75-40.1]